MQGDCAAGSTGFRDGHRRIGCRGILADRPVNGHAVGAFWTPDGRAKFFDPNLSFASNADTAVRLEFGADDNRPGGTWRLIETLVTLDSMKDAVQSEVVYPVTYQPLPQNNFGWCGAPAAYSAASTIEHTLLRERLLNNSTALAKSRLSAASSLGRPPTMVGPCACQFQSGMCANRSLKF